MCRDLHALQAVIFMIMFLQSSAKLSTCYAYIGIALRSALRMGLHRSMNDRFSPIENETRKRIFWVIRKMDIYVGALLGLPHTMSSEEIDQELPAELDDEYITETEYLTQPPGTVSLITACNAHTTLIDILAKVVRVVYPIKGKTHILQGQKIMSYTVSYADIRELERDLQQWMEHLPLALKPGGEATVLITRWAFNYNFNKMAFLIPSRVRQLLRMAYAHTQMMLYRPFVHYVSKSPNCASLDKRAYACASACISVSRNIIHITAEMKKRGMLNGCYWFTMYTTFFSIMTLVYFALENPESPTSQDVLKEAYEGKDVLEGLAKRSMAADRCTSTLRVGLTISFLRTRTDKRRLCLTSFRNGSGEAESWRSQLRVASVDKPPHPSPMTSLCPVYPSQTYMMFRLFLLGAPIPFRRTLTILAREAHSVRVFLSLRTSMVRRRARLGLNSKFSLIVCLLLPTISMLKVCNRTWPHPPCSVTHSNSSSRCPSSDFCPPTIRSLTASMDSTRRSPISAL